MIPANRIITLLVSLTLCAMARAGKGQDNADPKTLALKAISKIEQIPTIVLSGSIEARNNKSTLKMHAQGKNVWEEYEEFSKTREAEEKEALKRAKEITKSTSGSIAAFDGKRSHSFDPYRFEMRSCISKNLAGGSEGVQSMLPMGWLTMGRSQATFKDIIESKLAELRIDRMPDGKYEFVLEGIGAKLDAKLRDIVVMKTAKLIVDPMKDWLVVSYSGGGGVVGTVSGVLDWEKSGEHWYVKHAKHMADDKLYAEWFITEVSFNAKDCRTRFDDLESVVPFATKIQTLTADDRIESTKYQGGNEGETEHRRIQVALSLSRDEK